ncbi:hypothetical protein [Pseudopedobacter sp.]|uniref:hypothetical protein n=1 Tax=Pseudopedobacter sp. TaxID=1936787 RepID=UPI00333FD15E
MEKEKAQIFADILQECFQEFSLEETKAYLWQLFSLTVSGAYNRQTLERREKLLAVYAHLQQVLNALEPMLTEGTLNSRQLTDPCIFKSPE